MKAKYIVTAIRFALVSREYHREAAARQKRIADVWKSLAPKAEESLKRNHHGRLA